MVINPERRKQKGISCLSKFCVFHSIQYFILHKQNRKSYSDYASLTYSINQHRRCPSVFSQWMSASITVEAALVTPFFFLALLSFSWVFQILSTQLQVQSCLVQASHEYACYGTHLSTVSSLTKTGTWIRWKETDGVPVCYVDYREHLPFLQRNWTGISLYQQLISSEYAGESMKSEEENNQDETVYIAENATVYHKSPDCTYLHMRISSYTRAQVRMKRNTSGEIYYPCEDCCRKQEVGDGEVVYIGNYGNRFHLHRDCSKLKRTVREVKRSEVGDLPACSKCGT